MGNFDFLTIVTWAGAITTAYTAGYVVSAVNKANGSSPIVRGVFEILLASVAVLFFWAIGRTLTIASGTHSVSWDQFGFYMAASLITILAPIRVFFLIRKFSREKED